MMDYKKEIQLLNEKIQDHLKESLISRTVNDEMAHYDLLMNTRITSVKVVEKTLEIKDSLREPHAESFEYKMPFFEITLHIEDGFSVTVHTLKKNDIFLSEDALRSKGNVSLWSPNGKILSIAEGNKFTFSEIFHVGHFFKPPSLMHIGGNPFFFTLELIQLLEEVDLHALLQDLWINLERPAAKDEFAHLFKNRIRLHYGSDIQIKEEQSILEINLPIH